MSVPFTNIYTIRIFKCIKPTLSTVLNVRFKYGISKKASVAEHLGLPPKPRYPLLPYFQFLQDMRPSVRAAYPTFPVKKIVKIISDMWNSLDAPTKAKYNRDYYRKSSTLAEELAEYNKKITEEDLIRVKETRKQILKEIEKRRIARQLRKEALELNKPIRPTSAFLRYLDAKPNRQPNEKYTAYLKRKSVEWKNASENEREQFKISAKELEDHKNKMLEWKGQMIKLGKYEFVSGDISNSKKFETIITTCGKKKYHGKRNNKHQEDNREEDS